MAKSVKAEFTLALTGTPVENSLSDLWCIVDAVKPGHFKTLKEFAAKYMPKGHATEVELGNLKVELSQPARAPLMLRRSKDEHWKERPQKRELIHERTMPSLQAQAYATAVARARGAAGRKGARTGFDVMILSPKAGGVGINLTAATHVIHLTRWWNPAVEDQCTDRAYRIGQSQPVTVHYPLAIHPDYGESKKFRPQHDVPISA